MNFYNTIVVATVCLLCINWGGQESIERGKHSINYYGTIFPREGDPIKVENISISNITKQIPVYEVPSSHEKEVDQQGKVTTNYLLREDPRKGIITRIDLVETKKIEVPDPTEWKYTRKNGSSTSSFIKIVVTTNGETPTKHDFLIEESRKIFCSENNTIDREVPFRSLLKIEFEGYELREVEQAKNIRNHHGKRRMKTQSQSAA